MNERINELWARAVDAAVPETYTSLSWAQIEKIKLVFAQLIVQECMKVSNRSLSKYELPSDKIAEHFGVEE
jgi:hypothetical protein